MIDLLNDGRGGGIAIGKLAAGTDLNEINAEGNYIGEINEQCKKCFHFQVCANVMKNQLFIKEKMLKEENPKCEHFAPAEDVAEVKRGVWIKNKPNPEAMKEFHKMGIGKIMSEKSIFFTCSCCGSWGTPINKYCGTCGAKMEGQT